MRKQCKDCPYLPNSKFEDIKEEVLSLIEKCIRKGELPNKPHGCHYMTTEMIAKNKSEECIGHREHLKKHSVSLVAEQ